MSRDLNDAERDMWAATPAHFQPAADAEENAATRGSVRMLAWSMGAGVLLAVFAVAWLAGYFVRSA
jgi:hypothetical protein